MTADLLDYVLDAFKTHGHAPDLRGAITGLPGEAFITLTVPEPTPALHELARAMESEFDELGRTMHIQVRRPAGSLRGWLARWGRGLPGYR
ncbi:MAG: hypothetical protein P9E24_07505 [Candidatus Competibacter sp.]|nr:hypothetical protein [Candidatus Competibacter sp.]MDG4584737.1 hypothetical protein [Candidatus Competibacter sp.]